MNGNIYVLDCTLRDGGRIIDCQFEDQDILDISERLSKSGIDFVEVGFLRDWHNVEYKGNSTFFTSVEQIKDIRGIGDGLYAKIAPYLTV